MKAILTTLVLITLMMVSTARAGVDTIAYNNPNQVTFTAHVTLFHGDSLRFFILNPDEDDIVLKVFSDRDVKVMEYDLNNKKAVKLYYVMEDMRKCCYTAVVERNDKEVVRKKIQLK